MLSVADDVGIQFDERISRPCTREICIGSFMFSAAGIFRAAANTIIKSNFFESLGLCHSRAAGRCLLCSLLPCTTFCLALLPV
ncbi:hypothetical protein PC129_g16037 [Phytophthora cactorum]|uniref:Uncharacterized protein n=1 Tax=Phytophthora cactorum TaxID=29920 RepID=A0A8T1KAJ2_9STRA|nr:hypothetical protein PC122_g14620 [Phytophthora cactorum]KAG3213017.1 hypothetical protein PC129_g16037 [Phytophthora cactorum]KAG4232756.1 hypothetical protein PC116_g19012 [Phytophthora cactorum]